MNNRVCDFVNAIIPAFRGCEARDTAWASCAEVAINLTLVVGRYELWFRPTVAGCLPNCSHEIAANFDPVSDAVCTREAGSLLSYMYIIRPGCEICGDSKHP